MKYADKEVSDLTDDKLKAAYQNFIDLEAKRDEASKHEKFKKMQFPPPNPAFVKLKNELKAEIDKRNIKINELNNI